MYLFCVDEKWFPSTCWIGYGCKWCWLCPIIGSSSCHQFPSANNVIGVEAIVIEPVLSTENWFLLLYLVFEPCSNYFYALNFLLLSFFMTMWLLSAGFQLWSFLRRRCRTVSVLMSSHFFQKSGQLLFFFLSLSHPRGRVVSMTAKLSWSTFLLWEQSWILCSWHWIRG